MNAHEDELKRRIGAALWGLQARLKEGAQRYSCLMEPLSELAEPGETPLLGVMAAIWMLNPAHQEQFDLASRIGRRGFLAWCCSNGLRAFAILREALLYGPGKAFFFRPSALVAHFPEGDVAVPYAIVIAHGLDLNRAVPRDPRSDAAARQMLRFYCDHLDEIYGGADLLPEWFVAALRQAGPACAVELPFFDRPASRMADSPPEAPPPHGERRKGGVNVVGHLYAHLGVGEDVRCAAAALSAAGVEHVLINCPVGANISLAPATFDASVVDAPLFAVNILIMTAFETLRWFCTQGSALFAGRRTIGVWPWELPEWPQEFAFCYFLVDELWAISDFVRRAYELTSPVPVVHMPPAVLAPPGKPDRRQFGLDNDCCVFLVCFDGLSSYARKNPFAAVRAFRAAFPSPTNDVRLIVKTIRGGESATAFAELKALIAEDSRIRLIDADFSRGQMASLINSCDCLVSLHRSEGFGRVLAEALSYRRPIVATYWSGNLDFAHIGEQYLVEADLVPIQPGEYPHGERQIWAEPDPNAAVEALRAVETAWRRSGGRFAEPLRANASEIALFNPKKVGERYLRRLAIWDPAARVRLQSRQKGATQRAALSRR